MTLAEKLERFIDAEKFTFFKGAEFTPYWSRTRNGVRNSIPPEALWGNIIPTIKILDEFRERIGASVTLLSTYRSPAYNRAVGGETRSLHMVFSAIDFTCAKGTPVKWAEMIKELRTAGLFKGGVGIYPRSNFVHVDTRGYNANWNG